VPGYSSPTGLMDRAGPRRIEQSYVPPLATPLVAGCRLYPLAGRGAALSWHAALLSFSRGTTIAGGSSVAAALAGLKGSGLCHCPVAGRWGCNLGVDLQDRARHFRVLQPPNVQARRHGGVKAGSSASIFLEQLQHGYAN
jgi:hypothetical protein